MRFTKNYLKLMFEKISVNIFDQKYFFMKNLQLSKETCSKSRDQSRTAKTLCGLHCLGKPWPKVNNASVAHQHCASIDALGRFSVQQRTVIAIHVACVMCIQYFS